MSTKDIMDANPDLWISADQLFDGLTVAEEQQDEHAMADIGLAAMYLEQYWGYGGGFDEEAFAFGAVWREASGMLARL